MTGVRSPIIRFTYPRPAMPDARTLTERARARRPNAAYLLLVFVLFALASVAVLPEWLVPPTPAGPADPAAFVPGDQTVPAPTDHISGLIAASHVWLEGFAAKDAGQMARAANDVTRITGSLSPPLRAIRQTPRTRAAGSAGHLRAALAYLNAGVTGAESIAVTRGSDLLRLVQPAQPARS